MNVALDRVVYLFITCCFVWMSGVEVRLGIACETNCSLRRCAGRKVKALAMYVDHRHTKYPLAHYFERARISSLKLFLKVFEILLY